MRILKCLGKVRQAAILATSRRPEPLRDQIPTVSFTFDDFPRTALTEGGAILKGYGARGTYYTAMGLMNQICEVGRQFNAADLDQALYHGHELGSHTYHHASSRELRLGDFEREVTRGRQAIEEVTGNRTAHHFSYPYGHVTQRAKPRIGKLAASCRGIVPGINESPVDLNLLRANSLYSGHIDLDAIDRMLVRSEERGGWVIFYTHEIQSDPSEYGCTPEEFENVVKLAVRRGSRILPVGDVLRIRTGAACAEGSELV